MKKTIAFVAVAIVLMMPGKVFSEQTEAWKGIDWICDTTGGIQVAEDTEYLSLELLNSQLAMAYYCTNDFTDFRSASTPWVEVSFDDLYPDEKNSVQLWIRDECPPANTYFMTMIGTDGLDDTYFIQWRNPTTNTIVTVNTTKKRSRGVHTIRVEKTENGAVEYYIDDEWLWSTEDIPDKSAYEVPEYFGHITLVAQFRSATFTDYSFGSEYSPVSSSSAVELEVPIDIRPFSHNNKIYHWERGVIPVAILSNKNFDAPSEVDRESLTFGRTGNEHSKAFFLRRGKDVNHDGMKDLIFFFRAKQAGFEVGDTEGFLKGNTLRGAAIKGKDAVNIIEKRRWHFWRSHK
ncbi:MAG: hypothetical protein LJE87_02290 [Deltaproteobacteria bacterium]|nr:hypothetical protein [Deltaproteobacteria bacterium]